jgi:site-specific recombinase XerD
MGQIRKINDVYYIEFHARGLLYSQVAGPHLEEAQKLLLQVEEKIAGGEALTVTRHIELPHFFERFLSEASVQYSAKSVKRYATVILHFSNFLKIYFPQARQLDQLTPALIESYKVYLVKTQKAKTVNLSILLIRDILEFGIKLGFLNDNPSLHIHLLPWPKSPTRKATPRYNKAKQLLLKGASLSKLAQLLN